MEQLSYFNSKEAANILGVNVSTIKRWTEEGKLQCVKSSGGHRKFLMHHLSGFLESNKKRAVKATIFPVDTMEDLQVSRYIMKGDFSYLHKHALELALSFERIRLFKILQGLYLAQHPLPVIYDHFVVPLLHEIGTLWEQGQISVAEEHVASQNIRDLLIRLQAITARPPAEKGTALCLTFPDELHDIGLKMADHILELKGFKVLFSGQITPALSVEHLIKTFHPQRIYLSSTVVKNVKATQKELNQLKSFANQYGFDLYGGGPGFSRLNIETVHPLVWLPDFTALSQSLTEKS